MIIPLDSQQLRGYDCTTHAIPEAECFNYRRFIDRSWIKITGGKEGDVENKLKVANPTDLA